MKKNFRVPLILILFLALFFIGGCGKKIETPAPIDKAPVATACTLEAKICPDGSVVGRTGANCEFAACPIAPIASSSDALIYKNDQYGFYLNLSKGWEGYSVSTSSVEFGTKVLLRNNKWTKANPYEDIPVLVYPLAQWQKWEKNNFENYPTAAPIGPTERGRNNVYVFATAPRYNYDFSIGFEEVENIIKDLRTVTLTEKVITPDSAKTNIGLANPSSTYCVEHGGKSVIVNNPDGSQGGNCVLASGKVCEEWAYFRGECK